jgi:hypothetical protein
MVSYRIDQASAAVSFTHDGRTMTHMFTHVAYMSERERPDLLLRSTDRLQRHLRSTWDCCHAALQIARDELIDRGLIAG